jgi:hypothetical protein
MRDAARLRRILAGAIFRRVDDRPDISQGLAELYFALSHFHIHRALYLCFR